MKVKSIMVKAISAVSIALLGMLSFAGVASAQYAGTNGRIVFSSPAGYLTVKPDSSNLHVLGTAVTGCFNRAIVYSPNGNQLAYTGIKAGNTDGDIFLQNATFTATATQLTNDTASNDCDPYWSPDGTKIAYMRQTIAGGHTEVWVMNADGTGQTQLTSNLGGGTNNSSNPIWKDASTIYVVNTNVGGSGFTGITSISSTTANQTSGTAIYTPASAAQGVESFDINPAGNQISFSNGTNGIFTCALAATCTGVVSTIAPGASSISFPNHPAYSPDGTKIVFVGTIPGSPSTQSEAIYIANPNGTGIARMTFNSGGYQALAYSTYQPYWGTNQGTFGTSGGGGTTSVPGVPNTTTTQTQRSNPTPIIVSAVAVLALLGLAGYWIKLERSKKS